MSKLSIEDVKLCLKRQSRPVKIRELARIMDISSEDYPAFRRMVKNAFAAGQLGRLRGGRLTVEAPRNIVIGKLLSTRARHGFVIPDDKSPEVYIPEKDIGGALHGEKVKVAIKSSQSGKNREGRIIEVLNRESGRVVGHLKRGRFGFFLTPDDPRIKENVEIENARDLPLKDDLVVTARLYPWAAPYVPPRGYVEEVLGEAGAPGIDIDSLIVTRSLPQEFDAGVKPELARIRRTIPKKEIARRLDLRNVIVFTIDPADAKDHDDAISLEPLENGHFRLGVHIADVSHYVIVNSMLDHQARLRGNSIYLVDRVIPMLPEKLSGDICSLHEKQDRLTVSFLGEIDFEGRLYDWKFVETIISSGASLSYEDVQAHFDKKGKTRISRQQGEVLNKMLRVSQSLRQKRLEKGSLDFDLPEPKVILDTEGKVVDIFVRARMPSHQVVEEFMLLANRYAATLLEEHGIPILYRVHAKPDKEKIKNFSELLKEMGYDFSFRGELTPKKLQRVLAAVKDKPEEPFVEEILLRSLAKAVYQPENIGHFGLAFDRYTHFTSPIRRYPDLTVHRALKMHLNKKITMDVITEWLATLKGIGIHCTSTEIAADEAERDSVKIKQLEYLSERVGGIYDGIISGVVKSGMFVELIGSMVEGFVSFSNMRDDYYFAEEAKHRATGRRTKKVFRLGDRVRVIVAKVDIENRRSDFALVDIEERKTKRRKKLR